ncbi:MAG TPA: hypothetical protein VK841_22380 [Polyangiaceae bacterium]|jgi:hypothetical protein|nr:hypothetical protein [Polyangiaceae bacterium]
MQIVTRVFRTLACAAVISFFGCSSNNSSNCSPTTGTTSTGLLGGMTASCTNSSQQCSTGPDATTCETCAAQSCCSQTLSCKDDTTCVECADSCTDSQDCATCSGSDTTASGFFSCLFTKCSAQCGAATNACPAMAGDNACATCQKESCCTELVACNADTECVSLSNQLTTQCGDMNLSCDAQVVEQSGDEAAAGLLQCVQTNCSTQCGG